MPLKIDQFPRLNKVITLEHGYDILKVYNAILYYIEAPDTDSSEKEALYAIVDRIFIEKEPVID